MRRLAALALGLCLVVGFAAVSPCGAAAQEAGAEAIPPLEGKLKSVEPGGTIIRVEDTKGRSSTLNASGAAAKRISEKFENGLVKLGSWVRVTFDDHGPTDIEWIEEPRIQGPVLDPRVAQIERDIRTLKPGRKFELDGREVIFDGFDGTNLYYKASGDDKTQIRTIKQIGTLRLLAIEDPIKPENGDPDDPLALKPGRWFHLTYSGAKEYGSVILGGDVVITFELYKPGNTQHLRRVQIPTAQITQIEPAQPPDIAKIGVETPVGGPSTATATAGADKFPLQLGAPTLDADENVWKVPATVQNRTKDQILIAGRIEISFKGSGQMVKKAVEENMLREGVVSPAESGTFEYQGQRYQFRREPTGLVVAERTPNQKESSSVPLPAAVFPGFPEELVIASPLMDATVGPARVVHDPKNLIPFTDERAMPHLVRAYHDHSSRREPALDAIGRSQNPKMLGFLLYELYGVPGESGDAKHLKLAIGRMHDEAEKFLLGLLTDKGYAKALPVMNAQGVVEQKTPTRSEAVLTRVIECLDLLDSGRAYTMLLPYTRSTAPNPSEDPVAIAARQFFIQRGAKVVPFLVGKLNGPATGLARDLLLDIEMQKPGALGGYLAGINDTEVQAALQAMVGLSRAETAQKLLELIVSALRNKVIKEAELNTNPVVWDAKDYLQQLGTSLATISTLRRELAGDHASEAVRISSDDGDGRVRKMRLLRRALALDATNPTARRELADIFTRIGYEVRKGENLRTGPGDEYPIVRSVKVKESLAIIPPAEGEVQPAGWCHVKAADAEGWVSLAVAQEGKTQVVVLLDRRPLDHARKYFAMARAFDPDRAADIDRRVAEIVAVMAEEAADAKDYKLAYERYREAASLAQGGYKAKVATYYLLANPLLAALGLIAMGVFIGALVVGEKGKNRLKAGPAPAPKPGAPAVRESAPAAAPATKKVPS